MTKATPTPTQIYKALQNIIDNGTVSITFVDKREGYYKVTIQDSNSPWPVNTLKASSLEGALVGIAYEYGINLVGETTKQDWNLVEQTIGENNKFMPETKKLLEAGGDLNLEFNEEDERSAPVNVSLSHPNYAEGVKFIHSDSSVKAAMEIGESSATVINYGMSKTEILAASDKNTKDTVAAAEAVPV